jgi:hypothetical protein
LSPLFGQQAARYRKVGGRGSLALALVPAQDGRAALEALIGPLAAYEAIDVEQAVQPPLRPPLALVPPVPAPAARLGALAQRLDAVRPKRSWDESLMDWQAHQTVARTAAATLSSAEWLAWRVTVPAALDAVPPPIAQMAVNGRAAWPDR